MKNVNDFFGNAYIVVGALKSVLAILVILQLISLLLGGSSLISDYESFSLILGFMELALIPCSIVMIVLNTLSDNKNYVRGYWQGLLAIGIEFLLSGSFLLVFFVFFQCVMFLKAGTQIKTGGLDEKEIKNMKNIKNTEWFYEDK
jgi:hypothetical protein